jgi:hypothetical protein
MAPKEKEDKTRQKERTVTASPRANGYGLLEFAL